VSFSTDMNDNTNGLSSERADNHTDGTLERPKFLGPK